MNVVLNYISDAISPPTFIKFGMHVQIQNNETCYLLNASVSYFLSNNLYYSSTRLGLPKFVKGFPKILFSLARSVWHVQDTSLRDSAVHEMTIFSFTGNFFLKHFLRGSFHFISAIFMAVILTSDLLLKHESGIDL